MTRALRLSKAASALRVVERHQVSRFLGGVLQCFFELHSHEAAAAFRSLVLPVRDGSIDESNIGFVNQGRRLEREAGRLVAPESCPPDAAVPGKQAALPGRPRSGPLHGFAAATA